MSQLFSTLREAPKEAEAVSEKFLLRGKYIKKVAAGIHTFLPLGLMVQQNLVKIIDEEMAKIGGQKILMPVLQPKNLWVETDRWDKMDPPLFRVKDRHDREYALGSTHEEIVTDIIRQENISQSQLPLMFYQIQTKFRNEMRATGGLLRTREFMMKDGYSFHAKKIDLDDYYQKVVVAYQNIFKKLNLLAVKVEAHSGSIGGEESNEFMVLAETGEDRVLVCECGFAANAETGVKKCPKCEGDLTEKSGIEVAHIFKLNELYSKKLNARFLDEEGRPKFYQMGCYGIGVDRLIATIVEASHDEKGIIWPATVAPYDAQLIKLANSKEQGATKADEIYQELTKAGIKVLYDDRENVTAGAKFADADLLGMPWRIIISEKSLEKGGVELKKRDSDQSEIVAVGELVGKLK